MAGDTAGGTDLLGSCAADDRRRNIRSMSKFNWYYSDLDKGPSHRGNQLYIWKTHLEVT